MQRLRKWVHDREVWVFLCLIVVVNAVFVGLISNKLLPGSLYSMGRFALLGGVLGAVVLVGSGWHGIVELLRPMMVWRVHPAWYVVALVWAAMVATLVLVGEQFVAAEPTAMTATITAVAKKRILFTVLIGAFIGEIVWVSYALRSLSSRFTPFVSSQIVGVFWTLWWMPMVLLNYGIIPDLPPVALLINQTGIAAMCAFVYWHTRSGLIVLLLQIMVNSALLIFPVIPTIGGVGTYWAYAVTYYVCSVVLFLAFGPRPLFSKGLSLQQA
ncbi:MAG: CPBP family glutamic-type intramembrane protease [Paracoccaceae bacterium]